jgi:hypothetical protein
MIRAFRLFLFLGLFVLPTVGRAAYVWSFTNSGQVYGTTESIPLEARLTNTGTSSIVVDLNVGSFAQGFEWGTFPNPYNSPSGNYDFQGTAYDYFRNAIIQPGESRDFIFGVLIPIGAIAPGIYTTGNSDLSINTQLAIRAGTNVFDKDGNYFVDLILAGGNPDMTQFDLDPEYFSANVGGVPAPVPIPAAFWLLGSGLVGMLTLRRNQGQRGTA